MAPPSAGNSGLNVKISSEQSLPGLGTSTRSAISSLAPQTPSFSDLLEPSFQCDTPGDHPTNHPESSIFQARSTNTIRYTLPKRISKSSIVRTTFFLKFYTDLNTDVTIQQYSASLRHRHRFSSPESLVLEHYKAKQALILARASRTSAFAEERVALRQLEEGEVMREALRSEFGEPRSDSYKARQTLGIARAIRETLSAEEKYARQRVKEAELYLDTLRDAAEEAGTKAREAERDVGVVLEMLRSQGIPAASSKNNRDNYTFEPTRLSHHALSLFGEVPDSNDMDMYDDSDGSSEAMSETGITRSEGDINSSDPGRDLDI